MSVSFLKNTGTYLWLLTVPLIAFCCSCVFLPANKENTESNSGNDLEIEIIYNVEDDMFPVSWRAGDINGKALPLDTSEYDRTTRILRKAMSKYPEGILEKYLEKVYVVGYLEFFGLEYGGTNTDGIVYLSNRGEYMGYTDLFLEQSFHHELSSILFFAHPRFFRKDDWVKLNDFQYGSGGVNAIQTSSASVALSEYYAAKGVLSQYATSAIEEDFNTFAEQLFSASEGFWELTEQYPALSEKVTIMVEFYNAIHPDFTLEYFRKISSE